MPEKDYIDEPWYLTRSWTKMELSCAYGFRKVETLMKKFKDHEISTGGRSKHLSPLQVSEFVAVFGPPYVNPKSSLKKRN